MPTKTKEEIRKNMQAIRSKNTKIELILGKALWAKGYRYRKNNKKIFGTPDFTFRKLKIAIFCDGEFWHGKDWETMNKRFVANRDFWVQKIERNRARDVKVNHQLKTDGWTVIRLWEKDIKQQLASCLKIIDNAIRNNAQLREWKLTGRVAPAGVVASLQSPVTERDAHEYLAYLLNL